MTQEQSLKSWLARAINEEIVMGEQSVWELLVIEGDCIKLYDRRSGSYRAVIGWLVEEATSSPPLPRNYPGARQPLGQ